VNALSWQILETQNLGCYKPTLLKRKREEETYATKCHKAKLEHLRSAKLTHHDQAVTLLDMQRLSNGKGVIILQQLSINTFKQVLALFK
jgi:hypothetical protein